MGTRQNREEIFELRRLEGSGNQPPRRGKFDIVLVHTKTGTATEFVRRLLKDAPIERVLELIGIPRPDTETEIWRRKVESFARQMGEQIKRERLNRRTQEAMAAFVGFSLEGRQGKLWRDGTAEQFAEMLATTPSSAEPPPDQTAYRPASPPQTANLDGQRGGPSWSLLENLCSILLLGGQYDGADLDFELSGQPTRSLSLMKPADAFLSSARSL
jgi:hypothetical protein